MMVPSKSFSLAFAGLALAFAGSVSSAQSQAPVYKVTGPTKHVNIDLATGKVTGGTVDKAVATCWTNTDTSGFFSYSGYSGGVDQWMDWGTKACGGTGVIGNFTFGYASAAVSTSCGGPGGAATLTFQEGASGFGSFGTDVAGFSFTGLPAKSCTGVVYGWAGTVGLTGGGEFSLADGPWGLSWIFDDVGTGPLLVYIGVPGYNDEPDAQGDYDAFDWYYPAPASTANYLGAFWFGGAPIDAASWFSVLAEEDGACGVASSTFRNPTIAGHTNPAVYAAGAPILGGVELMSITNAGKPGATFAFVQGSLFPLGVHIGVLGCLLIDISIPSQYNLLAFLPPSPFAAGTAAFAFGVPLNLTLCGLPVSTQGIRFGGGVDLTNANDLVLGF